MKELNFEQFSEHFASDAAAVFAFGAPWCRDCVRAQPWLEQLAAKYQEVNFYHINVDSNEGARDALAIRHIPTILFCKNGEEVGARVVEPSSLEQLENAVKLLLA